MSLRTAHRFNVLKSGIVLAGLLLSVASPRAADLTTDMTPLPVRLQPSVTINEDLIKLSDLFSGVPASADRAIADAPRPGQRTMLNADWLQRVARDSGIDWQPANKFDRAIVFRPSQTVPASDILAAIKSELTLNGVPESYAIKVRTPMSTIAIPANAPKTIAVREVSYDATTQTFAAQVEVPAGDPHAYFLQIKGEAFPIVTAPVVKQAVLRDTVITADMIEMSEIRDVKASADTLLDPKLVVGKAAKGYLRQGQSLRAADVYAISMVSIPVLRNEMHRGTKINEAHLKWIDINADDLPTDGIVDAEQIIGFAPKRQLAAGKPLRTTDVQTVNLIEVPVAARDVVRGETLTAADLQWTTINRNDLVRETILSEKGLVGWIVNSGVRAGQPFRDHSVARPIVITKGKVVTLVYSVNTMKLTARGKVLDDGAVGQVVRVVNTSAKNERNKKDTNDLFAEVVDANTVRVTDQQNAMN